MIHFCVLLALGLVSGLDPMRKAMYRDVASMRIRTIESYMDKLPNRIESEQVRIKRLHQVYHENSCHVFALLHDEAELEVMAARHSRIMETWYHNLEEWKMSTSRTQEERIVFCYALLKSIERAKTKVETLNRSRDRLFQLLALYSQVGEMREFSDNMTAMLDTAEKYERQHKICEEINLVVQDFAKIGKDNIAHLIQGGRDRPIWPLARSRDLLGQLMRDVVEDGSGVEKIRLFLTKWLASGEKEYGKESIRQTARELLEQIKQATTALATHLVNAEAALLI